MYIDDIEDDILFIDALFWNAFRKLRIPVQM